MVKLKLKEVIGGSISRKIETIFHSIDGYLENFTALMRLETLSPFEIETKLERYIKYQNSQNPDFNLSIKFKNHLNFEICATTWRTVSDRVPNEYYDLDKIHSFFYVSIFHNRGWKFKYDSIIITDKNGEVIEDLS